MRRYSQRRRQPTTKELSGEVEEKISIEAKCQEKPSSRKHNDSNSKDKNTDGLSPTPKKKYQKTMHESSKCNESQLPPPSNLNIEENLSETCISEDINRSVPILVESYISANKELFPQTILNNEDNHPDICFLDNESNLLTPPQPPTPTTSATTTLNDGENCYQAADDVFLPIPTSKLNCEDNLSAKNCISTDNEPISPPPPTTTNLNDPSRPMSLNLNDEENDSISYPICIPISAFFTDEEKRLLNISPSDERHQFPSNIPKWKIEEFKLEYKWFEDECDKDKGYK